jgi:hypothetical protein
VPPSFVADAGVWLAPSAIGSTPDRQHTSFERERRCKIHVVFDVLAA